MFLRPHIAALSSSVLDVLAVPEGLAVLTGTGIELVDADLRPVATIAGEHRGRELARLPDGRFVVTEPRMTQVVVGGLGGTLATVAESAFVDGVCATPEGFIAPSTSKAWVDRGGEGRWIELAHTGKGAAVWGDRVVVAGDTGVSVLDASGAIVATRELPVAARPVVLASGLAIPTEERIVIVDANLADFAAMPVAGTDELIVQGDAVVLARDHVIERWEAGADAPAWSWTCEAEVRAPTAIGPWLVASSWSVPRAWILDAATGAVLAELALHSTLLRDAVAFGDGIAIATTHHELVWWRPEGDVVRLAHDVEPWFARAVPDGLATAEGHRLYLWRTDAQGPEVAPVATTIPLEVPIVTGGSIARVQAPGRFALRALDAHRRTFAIAPDATWRPVITRDDALAIVHGLVERDTTGELPAGPFTGTALELSPRLGQLPPAQTRTLHARALFAPTTLPADALEAARWSRETFFAELGHALGVSGRVIAAAVRGRKFPLVPPREALGYDYLGTFTTSGALVVADPAYVHKRAGGAISLAVRLKAAEGLWHVFVRNGTGEDAGRTAELVAIHGDGFDTYATEVAGTIGVDSGCAGIYDKAAPKRDPDVPVEEGIQGGPGALAWSGHGDGMYPVFVATVRGVPVKVRIGFLDGTDIDRTFATPRTGQTYSPRRRFALGEVLEHPKFGSGTVVAVSDVKIDVAFADGRRTLVHAKS